MRIIEVGGGFFAGTQPAGPDDWAAIEATGARHVVNNRPEGEDPGQPSSADEAAAAGERGLGYAHVPVSLPAIGEREVAAFGAALDAAQGPVFAHCRSGTRSVVLWAIREVRAGRLAADALPATGTRLGVDLGAAVAFLAVHGGGPARG